MIQEPPFTLNYTKTTLLKSSYLHALFLKTLNELLKFKARGWAPWWGVFLVPLHVDIAAYPEVAHVRDYHDVL